jgi:hypothetical protein
VDDSLTVPVPALCVRNLKFGAGIGAVEGLFVFGPEISAEDMIFSGTLELS